MSVVKLLQKIVMVVLCLFSIASSIAMAEGGAGVSVPSPAIDTSSPEAALRSYWDYLDWRDRVSLQYIQSSEYRMDANLRNSLLDGERLALENWRDREHSPKIFRREIVKTIQLGAVSAEIVTHIRNVTPTEPAINPKRLGKMDKLLFGQKTNGRMFKYLMGKKDGAWKVQQVFAEQSIYGDKTGWEPAYTIPLMPANTIALDP